MIGILTLFAVLTSQTVAAAADSEYFIVPQDSAVPAYCNTIEVQLWINATEPLFGGKVKILYTYCCANITRYSPNETFFEEQMAVTDVPGQLTSDFAHWAPLPTNQPAGAYHLGNFTIHCCNETSNCITDLLFIDCELYNQTGHKPPFVTLNGTFSCGMPTETTPPASITNLQNTTYAQTYINWTWNDPLDADFLHVVVYVDGNFRENVTKGVQYYNATGFVPDTEHIIATKTVDSLNNVNLTWINHTAKTAAAGRPDVVVTVSNVSFGSMLAGNSIEIHVSLTLNNTGDAPAELKAMFKTNVSDVYGLNGTDGNIIPGNNFKLGPDGSETALTTTTTKTYISTLAADENVTYDAILIVPAGQAADDYKGIVELSW